MNRTAARSILSSYLEEPVARVLVRLGVSPNAVTVAGLLIAGASAYLVSVGLLLAGGVTLLASGVLDLLDGSIARRTGKTSKRGALLDSVADRVSEAALLLGLLVFYLSRPDTDTAGVVLVYVTLATSVMVSYLRARGEGLGVHSSKGLVTRPERVGSLGIALIVAHWWLPAVAITLGVIAGLSLVTSAQRLLHAWRELGGVE